MKKLAQKLSFAFGSLMLATPTVALANNFFSGADPTAIQGPSNDTLGGTVTTIVNSLLAILGLVAVVFLIYAGVLMVTSAGNEEATGKAKKIITYAAIGIVIILLSYSIVRFVTNLLVGGA